MFTASDRGSLVQPALFCFVSSHFPVLLPFNDIGSSQVERRSGERKIKNDFTCVRDVGHCCCCCLHIKSRSDLYSVLSNIRTGPTDANAFRGHRLTTQKGYTYQKEIKGLRKVNTHAIIGK